MYSFISRHAMTALLAGLAPCLALAQSYPDKLVKVVVPSSPGGGYDTTARALTRSLQQQLGKPFIVENKPGAAGTIGAAQVAKSPADGYTLMWTGNGPVTLSPYLYSNAGYDPSKSFVPISIGATSSYALVVPAAAKANSVRELLTIGKAKSGGQSLTYASNGINSSLHLLGLLLATKEGVEALHVPYKGGASGVTAVVAGEVDFTFDAMSTAATLAKGGKLKVLATTGSKRDPAMPDVPTFAELGMPFMTFDVFYGLLAPAGTPPDVIDTLAGAMKKASADPDVRTAVATSGNTAAANSPQEFKALIDSEAARWKAVLQQNGIKPSDIK